MNTLSASMQNDSYRGIDRSAQLQMVEKIIELANEAGVNTQGTRIWKYKRYLESKRICDRINYLDIFKTLRERQISPFEWELYVTNEISELDWITKPLMKTKPPGYESKLKEIFGGADFSVFDTNAKARNTQFELKVAQYFSGEDVGVDFSTETDVIMDFGKFKLYIECKRIESEGKLQKNILEAKDQLLRRMPSGFLSKPSYGLIAIDVTNVLVPKGDVIFCNYRDELKDFLMTKLQTLTDRIKYFNRIFSHKKILGIHFHTSTPYCSITPKLIGSRLSNFMRLNDSTNGNGRNAIELIRRTQEFVVNNADISQPLIDVGLSKLDPSNGVYIDGFIESAIASYLENDPMKYVPQEQDILWGHMADGEKFAFGILELWKLGDAIRSKIVSSNMEDPVSYLAFCMLHIYPKCTIAQNHSELPY